MSASSAKQNSFVTADNSGFFGMSSIIVLILVIVGAAMAASVSVALGVRVIIALLAAVAVISVLLQRIQRIVSEGRTGIIPD